VEYLVVAIVLLIAIGLICLVGRVQAKYRATDACKEQEGNMTGRYACPCCSYLTRSEESPGTFVICPVCCWEDDNVQYDDPTYQGGANGVSLDNAIANFRLFGACSLEDRSRVRKPLPEECPPGDDNISGYA
jgi:hypothetical protein